MLLCCITGFISMVIGSRVIGPAWNATKVLAEKAGVAQIGTLIDAYIFFEGNAERKILADALLRLLPELQEADHSLLTEMQLEKIVTILHTPSERDNFRSLTLRGDLILNRDHLNVQIALIKALEHVGDGTTILAVRNIEANDAYTQGKKELKRAAQESLPVLVERAKRLKLKNVLLRPSTEASETLLRPAQSTGESDSETLLRHV
jgi:hypothetical protein